MVNSKRKKKQPTQIRKIYYFILGIIFIISLIASLVGSSKSELGQPFGLDKYGRPQGYISALDYIEEIDKYIDENTPSGIEMQTLERKKDNLLLISRYELYVPFEAPYHLSHTHFFNDQNLEYIYNKITQVSVQVWERLRDAISEPKDKKINELSHYMITIKPDIVQLIDLVESAPDSLDKEARKNTIRCLEKLSITIDREKEYLRNRPK